jgi:TPR repeat protein
MLGRFVNIVVLLIALSTAANAGYEEGVAAYNRGDFATALRELQPLAERGHAKAQFVLGFMHELGQGVARNPAEAANWYRKAAEQGEVAAQYNLSIMYETGEGVAKNIAEAAKWYRAAAQRGLVKAQARLGNLYANGQGVAQDLAEAAKWFRKAAEQGDAETQFTLARLYAMGQGVQKDYVRAHMWSDLAASRLPPGEVRDLAAKNREIVARRLTAAELDESNRLAREWMSRHPSR